MIILGSILGVLFLSIAGMSLSREIGVSARARAQVKALNASLERRVEQRTAALEAEAAARQGRRRSCAAAKRYSGRCLMESREYAVFMIDREGGVVSWNAGAARIKGYQRRGDYR